MNKIKKLLNKKVQPASETELAIMVLIGFSLALIIIT